MVSEALMDALEALFPDRCPLPSSSDQEVRMKMGEQSVVRFLKYHFNLQNRVETD